MVMRQWNLKEITWPCKISNCMLSAHTSLFLWCAHPCDLSYLKAPCLWPSLSLPPEGNRCVWRQGVLNGILCHKNRFRFSAEVNGATMMEDLAVVSWFWRGGWWAGCWFPYEVTFHLLLPSSPSSSSHRAMTTQGSRPKGRTSTCHLDKCLC